MARPKKIMALNSLLKYRIETNQSISKYKGKSKEYYFTNKLEKDLENILKELGYRVIKITKEFKLLKGICDFLCELENGEYLIIECKVSSDIKYESDDLKFSFAIGQLLTYRNSLLLQYEVPKEKIHLLLITDKDSLFTLSVIGSENLDISYMTYENGEVKYYGKERESW